VHAAGRVVGNALQHVGEPGLRINVVELCRLDERQHGGRSFATPFGTGKQPDLAPNR